MVKFVLVFGRIVLYISNTLYSKTPLPFHLCMLLFLPLYIFFASTDLMCLLFLILIKYSNAFNEV